MTEPRNTDAAGSYFRPIPEPGGRWPIAGGWVRFSRLERLSRDEPPRIVTDAPAEIMDRLTAARAPLLGLSMDRPRVMGIVNLTPDSFSDGGLHDDPARGLAHARALAAAGADILDLGGESTRPGAAEVAAPDEIARLQPVMDGLAGAGIALSVDTRKSAVARAAMAAGAGMINDVSGLDFDAGMGVAVASGGVDLCLMHAQGLPETMQDNPAYDDVLLDVYDALSRRVARAEAAGIPRARICVDPGIGFGKTQAHNLSILRRISLFHGLGCAILLGVSRKRFIGAIGDEPNAARRDPGTLAVTLAAVAQGVQIHRVHDVAGCVQGLALWAAVSEAER